MDESEVFVLIVAVALGMVGAGLNATAFLHSLYFRDNPAPGVVRVGVLLAMLWIAYVLLNHADPSVTGIYVVFYLVMGYAAIKLCGQSAALWYGFRTRIDVGERRNLPVAIVIAAFTVATGMIFGGSLWGEADPVGDDEGGWWIPVSFFLLGWLTLIVAFGMFVRREGRLAIRMRRERNLADARAASAFLLSSAVVLTDAVAGDFWGWRHGIFSFGLLAVLLLVHEAFTGLTKGPAPGRDRPALDARRVFESAAYLILAVLAWTASRYVDTAWGAG